MQVTMEPIVEDPPRAIRSSGSVLRLRRNWRKSAQPSRRWRRPSSMPEASRSIRWRTSTGGGPVRARRPLWQRRTPSTKVLILQSNNPANSSFRSFWSRDWNLGNLKLWTSNELNWIGSDEFQSIPAVCFEWDPVAQACRIDERVDKSNPRFISDRTRMNETNGCRK